MLSSSFIVFSNASSSWGFNMFYPGDLSVLSHLGKTSHSPIKRTCSHPICCSPTHLLLSFGTMITPPLAFNVLHLHSSQYIFLAFSTLLPLLSKPGGGSRSVNCYIFVHQFPTLFLFFNVVFADFPARHWSFHRFRSLTLSWFSLYF